MQMTADATAARREPLLWVVAVGIASGTWFGGYDTIMGQGIACIVNCILLIALILRLEPTAQFWRRAAPLLCLGLTAIGWALFTSIMQEAVLPDYAVSKLLCLLGGVAALLTGALCASVSGYRRDVMNRLILLLCAGFVVGVAVYQTSWAKNWFGHALDREGRFCGLVGNANVTASVAGIAAILLATRLMDLAMMRRAGRWRERDRISMAVLAGSFALCIGVSIATASRVTNLLLLVILLGLSLFAMRRQSQRARRLWIPTALVGIVGTLVILVLTEQLAHRFGTVEQGWAQRVEMWSHYWAIALDSPLIGYGAGSFPFVNASHLTTPRFAQEMWAVNSPHSLVLQLLLASGFPYLLLLLAAAFVGVLQVVRHLKGRWRQDDVVAAAMMLLILGASMVDIVLDIPATVTLFLFVGGLLWGRALGRLEVNIPFA